MSYFLHEAPLQSGQTLPLTGGEAHHLLKSRRIRVGERFALQDPHGRRFEAEVLALGRREATVAVRNPLPVPPLPPVRVALLQATVKEKAAETIVQKCTELGVAEIGFFPSQFGAVSRKALAAGGVRVRLERIAWEACKQSGRQFPPRLAIAAGLAEALEEARHDDAGIPGGALHRWLLHPTPPASMGETAPPVHTSTSHTATNPPGEGMGAVRILVGPEGGFGEAELAAARRAGYRTRELGANVLRAETAAVAACALALFGALFGALSG